MTGSQSLGSLTHLGVIFVNVFVHHPANFTRIDVILTLLPGAYPKILANLTDFGQ